MHGAILQFLEQLPVYNAINFYWSPDEPPNQTVDNTQITTLPLPFRSQRDVEYRSATTG